MVPMWWIALLTIWSQTQQIIHSASIPKSEITLDDNDKRYKIPSVNEIDPEIKDKRTYRTQHERHQCECKHEGKRKYGHCNCRTSIPGHHQPKYERVDKGYKRNSTPVKIIGMCNAYVNMAILVGGTNPKDRDHLNLFKNKISVAKELSRRFIISKEASQISALIASQHPSVLFHLDELHTQGDIDKAFNDAPYPGEGDNVGQTMTLAFNEVFGKSMRQNIPDVLVVLMDSAANDDIIRPAEAMRRAGVRVFCVGLGSKYDHEQLREMATKPAEENVLTAGMNDLSTVVDEITDRTCRGANGSIVRKSSVCPYNVNLGFLIDDSVTAQQYDQQVFHNVQDLIKRISSKYYISPTQSRVAVMQFSDNSRLFFDFNKNPGMDKVISAVNVMKMSHKPHSGEVRMGEALREAKTFLFKSAPKNNHNVLLVLARQASEDDVIVPSEELKNAGINIFGVGIGKNFDKEQLREVASGLGHVLATDFSNAEKLADWIVQETCIAVGQQKVMQDAINPSQPSQFQAVEQAGSNAGQQQTPSAETLGNQGFTQQANDQPSEMGGAVEPEGPMAQGGGNQVDVSPEMGEGQPEKVAMTGPAKGTGESEIGPSAGMIGPAKGIDAETGQTLLGPKVGMTGPAKGINANTGETLIGPNPGQMKQKQEERQHDNVQLMGITGPVRPQISAPNNDGMVTAPLGNDAKGVEEKVSGSIDGAIMAADALLKNITENMPKENNNAANNQLQNDCAPCDAEGQPMDLQSGSVYHEIRKKPKDYGRDERSLEQENEEILTKRDERERTIHRLSGMIP